MSARSSMQSWFPGAWNRLRYAWWELRRIARPYATIEGIRVPLDRSMPLDFRNALYHGNYERAEMTALQATLEPEDVVMEIGTGLGFLAAFAATVVGSDHVVTYEANARLTPLIKRPFRLKGVAARGVNAILADRPGHTDFFVEPLFYNSSTTFSEGAQKIPVRPLPLTDEMSRIKPTFVIMDVEGSESDLLPMMNLSSVNKVLIEFHPHVIGEERVAELVRLFNSHGLTNVPRFSSGVQSFFARTSGLLPQEQQV